MKRPLSVTITSVVALLQGVALLVVAAVYVLNLLTGSPVQSVPVAVTLVILFVLFGLWLAVVGHFLFRGYRWPRSGAVIAQLFVIVIGVPAFSGGNILLGIALVVPAAVALLMVFDPRAAAFGVRTLSSGTDSGSAPEQGQGASEV